MTIEQQTPSSPGGRLRNYLTETRSELRKVIWPTPEETVNLTVAVLFVTLFMTILLAGVDWFFTAALEQALTWLTG